MSGPRSQGIINNTVINTFSVPSIKKREASTDYDYETPRSGEFLLVDCLGAQGDHMVLWSTDNDVVGEEDGVVNCNPLRPNAQDILSNYTARYWD
jgi:hypothetical protein